MQKVVEQNPSEKMAFNPSNSEKRVAVYPKILRFTQLDIAPSFTDRQLPNVREAVSLIRGRQLDPAVFGDLTVHRDKQGVVWCDNNRRLYVLRMAGVPSVRVKFVSNDYISRRIREADKIKLNDPNFMPRIRSETSGVQNPALSISGASFDQLEQKWMSGVQIPPTPSFGTSVDQEQKGTSLLGFMSAFSAAAVAVYGGWKLYNSAQQENEDVDRDDRNQN